MNLNISTICDTLYPAWVTASFPIIRMILIIIMAICSISLIITVLLQSNTSSGGANAISGVQESYYSNNKGGTRDGRLKKLTITAASIIAGVMVLFLISYLIYPAI